MRIFKAVNLYISPLTLLLCLFDILFLFHFLPHKMLQTSAKVTILDISMRTLSSTASKRRFLSFWGENHPFGSSWPGTHLKNWSRQFNSGISHLQLCHHWQQQIKRKCLELTWWVLSMENEEEATMVKEEKKRRRGRNLPVVETKMITLQGTCHLQSQTWLVSSVKLDK